jgi:hypothetical protein
MLTALLLFVVTSGPNPEAVALNTEGFRLYKQGAFEPALEKFKAAIAADELFALAHYNASATMARMDGTDPCPNLSGRDVLGELARAIALDPGRRARALKDPDFTSHHSQIAWRRLVLNLPANANVRVLLEGTTFTSAAGWGSYGNGVDLRFLPGGKLLLGLRVLVDDKNLVVDHPGSWTVEGTTLHVRMKSAADKAYSGDAVFSREDSSLEWPGLGKLVNYVSGACDA